MHVARKKKCPRAEIEWKTKKNRHRENKWLSNQFDMGTRIVLLWWFELVSNKLYQRCDTFDVQGNGLSWFMTLATFTILVGVCMCVYVVKLGHGVQTALIKSIYLSENNFTHKHTTCFWIGKIRWWHRSLSSFCLMTSFIHFIPFVARKFFILPVEFWVVKKWILHWKSHDCSWFTLSERNKIRQCKGFSNSLVIAILI